jgi:hypothetical protein
MQDGQDVWEKNIHPKNYMDVKVDANQCYTVKHGLKSLKYSMQQD